MQREESEHQVGNRMEEEAEEEEVMVIWLQLCTVIEANTITLTQFTVHSQYLCMHNPAIPPPHTGHPNA